LLIWPVRLFAAAPLAAALVAPALGQNLDAGKPPSQIFSEVCANCHRSTRDVRGASASFLREHYTTGSEMASSLANYLSGAGDPRPATAQPKRPPAPVAGAATTPAVPDPKDSKPTPAPANAAATARGRPTTADAKPVAAGPQVPARPVLEEFEE
jgi:hypothetical protein